MTAVPNENISASTFMHDPCAEKPLQRLQPSPTTATDSPGRCDDVVPDIILALVGPDPLFLQPAAEVQSPYLSEAAV